MEHMFQLTYGNRALKVWAALARLGRSGLTELVTRCNRLATLLEARRARRRTSSCFRRHRCRS